IYSEGGSFTTALKIAQDVRELHAETYAPSILGGDRALKEKGTWVHNTGWDCDWLPGEADRRKAVSQKYSQHLKTVTRARKRGRRAPPDPRLQHSTFDPKTGNGDRRCICASACFFIWLGGAKRNGEVLMVHRPYIDRERLSQMDADAARKVFRNLNSAARKFLADAEVADSVVSKLFATPSTQGRLLTKREVAYLRNPAYLEEMKVAQCGPPPGPEPELPTDKNWRPGPQNGKYQYLKPQRRRHLMKKLRREMCWQDSQIRWRREVAAKYVARWQQNETSVMACGVSVMAMMNLSGELAGVERIARFETKKDCRSFQRMTVEADGALIDDKPVDYYERWGVTLVHVCLPGARPADCKDMTKYLRNNPSPEVVEAIEKASTPANRYRWYVRKLKIMRAKRKHIIPETGTIDHARVGEKSYYFGKPN
ncbi:MAG: hypothetical protein AAF709_21740, partial [Pseudomonadota bacterium]